MEDQILGYRRRLELFPANREAFEALAYLYEKDGRLDELARLLEGWLETVPDDPQAAEVRRRLGVLYAGELADAERALSHLTRAHDADPAEAGVVDALIGVQEKREAWPELATLLAERARTAAGAEAAAYLERLAAVQAEHLGRPDLAISTYRAAFETDAQRVQALEKARALAVDGGDLEAAATLLDRQAEASGEDGLGGAYLELGRRLAEEPWQRDLARRCLDRAKALGQTDHVDETLAGLEAQAKGWKEMTRKLRAEAVDAREKRKAAAAYLRIAELHALYDDDAKKVSDNLERVFLLHPGSKAALDFLERYHGAREDWHGLVAAYERVAGKVKDRAVAANVLVRLARLQESRLQDREAAAAAYRRALEIDPSHKEAARALVEALEGKSAWADAAHVLEKRLAAVGERDEQIRIRIELAHLFLRQLDDPETARGHLEAVLRIDPHHAEAARELDPLYRQDGSPEALARVLEIELEAPIDSDARRVLLERLAELQAGALNDRVAAARTLGRALAVDPTRKKLVSRLEETARSVGRIDLIARALSVAADAATSDEARVPLLLRLAAIEEGDLGDAKSATEVYRLVLEKAPGDPDATAGLERVLEVSGAGEELTDALTRQAKDESDPAKKREILLKLARHYDRTVGKGDKAKEIYRRLAEQDPKDEEVASRLEEILARLEDFEALAEVLRARRERASADEWPELTHRLADVLLHRLDRTPEAAALYCDLFAAAPRRAGVQQALESLFERGIETERIASLLEPHYAAEGDWVRHLAILEHRLEHLSDPAGRADLLSRIAVVHEEHLVDKRQALAAVARALRETPADNRRLDDLQRLARETGAYGEYEKALFGALEHAGQMKPDQVMTIRTRLADLRENALGDAEGAAEVWEQILAETTPTDPAYRQSLEAIVRIARENERWAALAEALKRLADVANDPAAVLAELGEVMLERTGDAKAAAAILQRALDAGADEAHLLPLLEDALGRSGESEALAKVQARRIEMAESAGDAATASRLKLEHARLLSEGLGQTSEAIAGFEAVLAERPGDPDALAALEKLLDDETVRLDAARVLMSAYERSQEYGKLVSVLGVEAENAGSPEAESEVLRRIAEVQERQLRKKEDALETLSRAVIRHPVDPAMRGELKRLADEIGALEAVAPVLDRAARGLEGPAKLPLMREAAEWAEKRQGDRASAVSRYQAMLEVDDESLDALMALHRLHRAAEDWSSLAATCLKLAAVVYDDGERMRLWREAGRLYEERLQDPAAAAEAYRRILEVDETDPDVARILDRLYVTLGRYEDLAWVLEKERAQAGDGDRQQGLVVRLADVLRRHLGRLDDALDLYRGLLDADPAHPPARQALSEVVAEGGDSAEKALALLDPYLQKLGEHRARIDVREQRLARAATENMSAERRSALFSEIRGIYENDIGADEMGFMTACRQLQAGVGFEVARDEAERLGRKAGNLEELVEVFDEVAGGLPDVDPRKIDLLRREAGIRAEISELPDDAIEVWKKVQALAPADPAALEALETLYKTKSNAQDLVDLYRQKVELAAEGPERLAARLDLGRLLEQTSALEQAIDAYESVAREADAHPAEARRALEQLDRLYERAERHQDLARVLASLVRLLGEDPARLRYMLRLGRLFETHDAHPSRALELYGALLDQIGVPDDASDAPGKSEAEGAIEGLERLMTVDAAKVKAAERLEPIYRERLEGRKLIEVLEARLTATRDPEERLVMLEEIAKLYEVRLGQKPLAFMVWCRAFQESAGAESVRERLEALAAETESWEELAGVYEDTVDRLGESAEGAEIVLTLERRLTDIYEHRLSQVEAAVRHQRRVVELSPPDAEAVERLARLLRTGGDQRELIQVYRRLVDLLPDGEHKKELWFEIAGLTEEVLGDPSGAVDAYRQVLALSGSQPDREVLALLERLLVGLERWPEVCEVLEKAAALEGGTAAADRLARLGRVKQVRLDDPVGAVDAYRRALEADPDHAATVGALQELLSGGTLAEGAARTAGAQAAALLGPRYAESGDVAGRLQSLEMLAADAESDRRADLLLEVAELYQGAQDSPEMAFMAASRALKAAPERVEILERLHALSAIAELEEAEAHLLADLVPGIKDERVLAGYHRRLGDLYADAGEVDEALPHYRALLEIVPDDAEALDRLSRLTRLTGDHAAHVDVLRRQLALTDDEAERVRILRQMASLQEDVLGDLAGALQTYQRLLEGSPDDREALARVDALCLKRERWQDLAGVLEREARTAAAADDVAAQVGFLFRLAVLDETELHDPDGAMTLFREVLRIVPGHPETVAYLESLLERDKERPDIARILEEVYREQGAWQRLIAMLEVRAAGEPEREERVKVLWEMHEVQEQHLGSPDMAFIVLCRAFNEDPTNEQIRAGLTRLADVTGQHEELAAVFEDALDQIGVPEVVADMSLTVARLNEEKLRDPDAAISYYERVLKNDPDTLPALVALDRLYRSKEAWGDLVGILEREAALTEDWSDKTAVLFRLGQLVAEKLDAPDRAAAVYEQLLEIDHLHMPAIRALEALYERSGAWEKLAANLETQLERAKDDAAKERLTVRLAEVVGTSLGEHARAIELWKSVLELNHRSETALLALEKLYEATEAWSDLAGLLRGRLSSTIDPREITRLNDRLGWVLGAKLGESEQATKSFRAVLERDPRNLRALEALRDIHTAAGEWEELITVLKRLVPLQETPDAAKKVRFRLAEVLGTELGRRQEAIEAAHRFLDIEPHTPETLEPLEGLLRTLEAPDEAVKVMELRARALAAETDRVRAAAENVDEAMADEMNASAAEIDKERVALLFDIARAHADELSRAAGGAEALEEVLALEPANRDAFDALRGIYESNGRWRELAALVDRFIAQAADADEKKALRLEVARLQEQKLGQKEMAFIALSRAIAESPEDEAIEADLLRLAEETDAWDEVSVVLEDVGDGLDPGPRKAALLLSLARVQDRHLDDPDEAESAIRKVLAFDPGSSDALEALADLFVRHEKAQDLVVALEQKLEATGDPEEQKAVLGRIAKVYESEVDDLEEAVATWKRVLELDGADATALDELARIFEAGERWDELVTTLERAVPATADMTTRAGLLDRIGHLYEDRLENDESAIRAFRQATDAEPSYAPALASLERIYTRLERWDELLKTYEAEVEVAGDDAERVRLLLRIAALQSDQFDRPVAAIDAFDRVLAIDAENLPAIKGLVRELRVTEDWERLIDALDRQVALTHDMSEAVRLHIELGTVWHDQMNRVDKAENIFTHALEIDPESRPALAALAGLYERSGNWNLALEMMNREAKLAGMGDDAVELFHRIGKIQEDMLLDTGAARAAYEQALDIEPGYLPAIQALKNLSELDKDWDKYLESLVQEAKHTPDLGEKTKLLYQIGVFYRDEREDPVSALRYFEDALQKTEDDVPSAEAASAIHLSNEGYDRAEELLRIVCNGHAAAGLEAKALCQWWYKLGYVRQKLERTEEALEAFRRAYECDATYLPALEGLGAALVSTGRWDEALKIYQTILIHHRESVTDLEVVEYYWQLGEINRNLDQIDRAVKNYEKALEIDPDHEPSLTGIIRLLEEQESFEQAIEYRTRLLESLDGETRYEMLLAIGRTAREKLEDPYQAIDAYLGAHKLREDAVAPLESLLVLYRETRQSAKAVDVLEKLLAHPEIQADRAKARRYHMNLGEIYRDDLKDPDKAIAHFDAALDIDYTFAKAFAAIEEILGRAKRWTDLEQAYVRMIQRLPKKRETHAVRMGLWKTLGELYRKVIKNLDGAIAAYQVVCKGDAEDTDAIEILADLLSQKPGAEKEAVAAFHEALKVTTEPVRVARALLRLYSAEKNYDKAFGVAAVIVHLIGDAQPDEQKLYERLKPYGKDTAQRPLTDRLWEQHLYHEKLKGPVSEILAILYEQAGSQLAVDPKELGLNPRKDIVDPGSSMLYFANMYKYVGRVLGMEGVPLYKQAQQGEGLALANTFPVSLIANEEMLGRSKKRQLWFTIAKAMAFARPELALGRLHSLEELDLFVQSAASLVNPRFPVTLDPKEIQKVQKKLQRALSPAATQALTRVVRGWKPDRALAELRAYAEGVEHTANRAGILLAGDVEVARACLMEDRGGAAKLPLRSKVRELVMFCLSESYFQLREELGIALEIQR